jgi:hypothetical protein
MERYLLTLLISLSCCEYVPSSAITNISSRSALEELDLEGEEDVVKLPRILSQVLGDTMIV